MYTPFKQLHRLVIKDKLVEVIPVLTEEAFVQLTHDCAVLGLDTVSVYRVAHTPKAAVETISLSFYISIKAYNFQIHLIVVSRR